MLANGCRKLFSKCQEQGREVPTHLCVMPRYRMSAATRMFAFLVRPHGLVISSWPAMFYNFICTVTIQRVLNLTQECQQCVRYQTFYEDTEESCPSASTRVRSMTRQMCSQQLLLTSEPVLLTSFLLIVSLSSTGRVRRCPGGCRLSWLWIRQMWNPVFIYNGCLSCARM
jgi:hypothetical protein